MYKAVRSLSLALVLTLAAVPCVKADRWGTNPRPDAPTDDASTMSVSPMSSMVDAFLFNLGML